MVRNGEIGLAEAKRTLRRYWWLLPLSTLFLGGVDRKSTRLNSSHSQISYAVFCLKKKNDDLLLSQPNFRKTPTTCAPPPYSLTTLKLMSDTSRAHGSTRDRPPPAAHDT